MENETAAEIQKHTGFLVEEFEHQLQKAAAKIVKEYKLEPEELDNPGQLAPEDYNEDSALEWDRIVSDWKFYIKIILTLTVSDIKDSLELNTGV